MDTKRGKFIVIFLFAVVLSLLISNNFAEEQNNAEAHFKLGNALYKKGLLDEAIKEYKEAIRINIGYAMAHYNLGFALKDKGSYSEAINAFENFIKYAPKNLKEKIKEAKKL